MSVLWVVPSPALHDLLLCSGQTSCFDLLFQHSLAGALPLMYLMYIRRTRRREEQEQGEEEEERGEGVGDEEDELGRRR